MSDLHARRTQHPGPDLVNQPGLLGKWDEHAGTEPPTGRMVPADEGFRPGEFAGLQIDDGLVEQDELTLRDRPAEFGLELDLALRGLLHRRLERDHLIAARDARDRPCQLGVSQQADRVGARLEARRHAEADREMERPLTRGHRLAEGGQDPVGHNAPIFRRRIAIEQHAELVPA